MLNEKIVDLIGTSSDNIERLFTDPVFKEKEGGTVLDNFASKELQIKN